MGCVSIRMWVICGKIKPPCERSADGSGISGDQEMSGLDRLGEEIAEEMRVERGETPFAERLCVNCEHYQSAEWPRSKVDKHLCDHPEAASRVDGSEVSCTKQRESLSYFACGRRGRLFAKRLDNSVELAGQPLQAEVDKVV